MCIRDRRYPFPTDTFANIYTAGLLGEQYIGLEAGGDDVDLKNGDKIAKTQDAIVLEKMISQFLFSKASETEDKNSKNEKDAVKMCIRDSSKPEKVSLGFHNQLSITKVTAKPSTT